MVLSLQGFWKFLLRKDLPSDLFAHMTFALFGLGDSAYTCFNFAGKKLYRRLLQLGAHQLIERGDGNEQDRLGQDTEFIPWCSKLWSALELKFPIDTESFLPVGQL
jgi:sulfite reductase alpha subunit-like flavoprotein